VPPRLSLLDTGLCICFFIFYLFVCDSVCALKAVAGPDALKAYVSRPLARKNIFAQVQQEVSAPHTNGRLPVLGHRHTTGAQEAGELTRMGG
jgi:hypothetical protein